MSTYQELLKLPYKEFLEEVLRPAPKNCTRHAVRDWLEEQYTQDQLEEMYCKLYRKLTELTPDDRDEDPAAEILRDEMDVFWFAVKNHKLLEIKLVEIQGYNAML